MPDDGVLKVGRLGDAEWLVSDVDLAWVDRWRCSGAVLNFRDWPEQQLPVQVVGNEPGSEVRAQTAAGAQEPAPLAAGHKRPPSPLSRSIPVVERVTASPDNLDTHARLRMAVFRAWPYLYDGDFAYEERYLREFLSDADAIIVTARLADRPVGMATASPLAGQPATLTGPLERAGVDVARSFYFGESVLLPEYRGLGIGHRLFDERERSARAHGAAFALFCTVVREADHPLRPAGARDLSPFWRQRGYIPLDGASASIAWGELGRTVETPHPMQFWLGRL